MGGSVSFFGRRDDVVDPAVEIGTSAMEMGWVVGEWKTQVETLKELKVKTWKNVFGATSVINPVGWNQADIKVDLYFHRLHTSWRLENIQTPMYAR